MILSFGSLTAAEHSLAACRESERKAAWQAARQNSELPASHRNCITASGGKGSQLSNPQGLGQPCSRSESEPPRMSNTKGVFRVLINANTNSNRSEFCALLGLSVFSRNKAIKKKKENTGDSQNHAYQWLTCIFSYVFVYLSSCILL